MERFIAVSRTLLCVAGKDGALLKLSPAWEQSLGYGQEELGRVRLQDLAHPDDLKGALAVASRLRHGQPVTAFPCRVRHKNGAYRHFEWDCHPDGDVVYLLGRDITDSTLARNRRHQGERRFRRLLDTVEAVAVQGYSPDGTINYWNAASEAVYGYTRQEALGRNLVDLIIPEPMRQAVREAIRTMAETGQPLAASELTLMRKDGSPAPVFSSHAVVKAASGETVLFCMDVDISPLRRTEEALRLSGERLRMLVENAGDALFLTDLSGRLLDVNPEAVRQTGFSREELLSKGIPDLDLNQTPETFSALARLITTRGGTAFETRQRTKQGGSIPVELKMAYLESEGGPMLMGIARDITERKRTEDVLTKANQVLTAVLDSVPAQVSVLDVQTRTVLFMNKAMKEHFGRDCIGENCFRAFRGQGAPCGQCVLPKLFDESGDPGDVHVWESFNPEEGTWNLNHDKAVRWLDGRMARVQITTDITGRKREEEDMAASLREKEILLREIHHRVKNNLQIISSLLSLQEGHVENPAARAVLADSIGRVSSMAMIHEQLYRSSDFSKIDLEAYLRQLLPRIVNSFRGHRVITLRLDASPLPLTLEQAIPLGLVMNELAVNALKHGFRNSQCGTLRVAVKKHAGQVVVEVANDGEALPDGFDPVQTETLGMQLVVTLTSQLKGRLEVDGRRGAAFRITFPLARP